MPNSLIIIGIIALVIVAIVIYAIRLNEDVEEEEIESQYSIKYLRNEIARIFAETQKENLSELNLTKNELEAEQRKKRELRKNLKGASFGDPLAKDYIKSLIKDILLDEAYGIDESTINSVIPFNIPTSLNTRDKIDILFHLYRKNYGDDGLIAFINDFNLLEPKAVSFDDEVEGKIKYEITSEDIDNAFEEVKGNTRLTFNDKLEVVTQRIFADYTGFGPIDSLFYFRLDEIQAGVNGVPYGKIKVDTSNPYFEYSYESIWIVYKGINVKMSCMSFGSQDELIRITKNIYKYETTAALSRNKGHIVSQMIDGSRASVTRPPECNSYSFVTRKFNSVSARPTLEELFPESKQHNTAIIKTLLIHALKTRVSSVITGSTGDGKSTLLRSLIGYIPSDEAIRVYEMAYELNLQGAYPGRNIVSFAITQSTTMQELFDFGKKYSGDITIMAETATAEMGCITLEAGRVISEMVITTHHAMRTEHLVSEFTDYLITAGGYTNMQAAEEIVVNTLNFDIHLKRHEGMRYIERITEIVPIYDRRYPSEVDGVREANNKDTLEYYRRQTDRKNYRAVDICRFSLEDMSYHMINKISDNLYNKMLSKLVGEDKEIFINDMQALYEMIEGN